jgi:hypothetical protein
MSRLWQPRDVTGSPGQDEEVCNKRKLCCAKCSFCCGHCARQVSRPLCSRLVAVEHIQPFQYKIRRLRQVHVLQCEVQVLSAPAAGFSRRNRQ